MERHNGNAQLNRTTYHGTRRVALRCMRQERLRRIQEHRMMGKQHVRTAASSFLERSDGGIQRHGNAMHHVHRVTDQHSRAVPRASIFSRKLL